MRSGGVIQDLGWIEGQSILIEERVGDGSRERARFLVAATGQ